jgi:hypothetical protein
MRVISLTIGGLVRPALQLSKTISQAVHASAAAIQHMGVNHRSAHIAVGEEFLNRADVVAVF